MQRRREIYKPYSCSISAVGRANVGVPAVGAQLRGVLRGVKFTNPTVVQFQQRGVQMWEVQPWGRCREVIAAGGVAAKGVQLGGCSWGGAAGGLQLGG